MPRPMLLFAVLLWTAAPLSAIAHEAHEFEPLSEVVTISRPSGRMLFFPFPDDFEKSSPYALLPAVGRRIVWTPESAQLPQSSLSVSPIRAIGSPPPAPEAVRYLVPVLDGVGAGLEFLAGRLDSGRFLPYEGEPKAGLDVVPLLAGPRLDATPSKTPLERVLDDPVALDAGDLTDVAPALLVRKASPSRVVFGVRLSTGYVPLIGESGVAFTARRDGRPGLAVAAPVDVALPPPTDGGGGGDSSVPVLPIVAGALAAAAAALVARRRWVKRRRR